MRLCSSDDADDVLFSSEAGSSEVEVLRKKDRRTVMRCYVGYAGKFVDLLLWYSFFAGTSGWRKEWIIPSILLASRIDLISQLENRFVVHLLGQRIIYIAGYLLLISCTSVLFHPTRHVQCRRREDIVHHRRDKEKISRVFYKILYFGGDLLWIATNRNTLACKLACRSV